MNTLQNSFSVKVQIHKMPRLKLYTSTDTPEYCSRVHHSKQEYVKISKKNWHTDLQGSPAQRRDQKSTTSIVPPRSEHPLVLATIQANKFSTTFHIQALIHCAKFKHCEKNLNLFYQSMIHFVKVPKKLMLNDIVSHLNVKNAPQMVYLNAF